MSKESSFLGISVRGWMAIVTVSTVCGMSIFQIEVKEPLYTLVLSVSSFYLGKMSQPSNQKPDGVK